MKECNDLNDVRESIDKVDKEIIKLIAERSFYVHQAAKFKKDKNDVQSPDRVKKVIEKVRLLGKENGVNEDLVEKVYTCMIESFINLELKEYDNINK
jgi:isochorismate pyruvate lyase